MPWKVLHGSNGTFPYFTKMVSGMDVIFRILVTFAIFVVIIRGISAVRRGDGYQGQLVFVASLPYVVEMGTKANSSLHDDMPVVMAS
jgi:hypothetical protein